MFPRINEPPVPPVIEHREHVAAIAKERRNEAAFLAKFTEAEFANRAWSRLDPAARKFLEHRAWRSSPTFRALVVQEALRPSDPPAKEG